MVELLVHLRLGHVCVSLTSNHFREAAFVGKMVTHNARCVENLSSRGRDANISVRKVQRVL